MSLSIKINGQPYTNFQEASVVNTIGAVTRGFSFVSTSDDSYSFPIKVGDEVIVVADEDIQILDGYIETLDVSYDSTGHNIRVGGRSKLADLVDSSVPTQLEIDGTTLEAIASGLLSALGIDATVEDQTEGIRKFEGDITSAEIGQNAFTFLESYARKRQVLLTSDGSNTLILTRTGDIRAPIDLVNMTGAIDNNILKSTLKIDYSKRFYKYVAKAQLNPVMEGFTTAPKDVADQEGQAIDSVIRSSRLLEFNSEESMDSFSSTDRAVWEKNMRIGAALNYTATVVGNTADTILWEPNTIVRVFDEFARVNGDMLIKDVKYDFSLNGGSTTTLTMVRPEAFTLELEQAQREAEKKDIGDDFIT